MRALRRLRILIVHGAKDLVSRSLRMLRAYIFLAGAGAGAAAAAAAFVLDFGAAAAMDDDFLAAGLAAGFDFLAAGFFACDV